MVSGTVEFAQRGGGVITGDAVPFLLLLLVAAVPSNRSMLGFRAELRRVGSKEL